MKPAVRSQWAATVLVCGKCSRKLGGGFGEKGRTPLAKALRALGGGRKRKARFGVIETPCLGICPKRAVMVIDAARPQDWLIVKAATPLDEVVDRLELPVAPPAN